MFPHLMIASVVAAAALVRPTPEITTVASSTGLIARASASTDVMINTRIGDGDQESLAALGRVRLRTLRTAGRLQLLQHRHQFLPGRKLRRWKLLLGDRHLVLLAIDKHHWHVAQFLGLSGHRRD